MELCRKAFLRRRHKKIRASEACLKLFAQPVVISVLNETCQSSNVLSCTKKKKVKAPFPKDDGQNARQRSMRMESQPARVRLQASIVRRLVWSFSFFNVPFTFDHPRMSINNSTGIQSLSVVQHPSCHAASFVKNYSSVVLVRVFFDLVSWV